MKGGAEVVFKKEEVVCDCDIIHQEAVDKSRKLMPEDNEIYNLSDFFKVLGDSTRLRILWALDDNELCVCDLAALLNMTQSAISHQLRALREATLVKNRREGKNIFYSIADDHIKHIIEIGLDHIRE